MFPSPCALLRRCLAPGLLAVVASSLVAPIPVATAATTATSSPDTTTVGQAVTAMAQLLNKDRAAAGLVAVRADARLMAIAAARSADMATKHYFSHTQPDGRNVFDILSGNGISWYSAGEIIAWNNYPMYLTAGTANAQWMASPGHHAIIVSSDFNYFGVGLATDQSSGKKYWTAVFMKGPDRTGARAASEDSWLSPGPTSTTRIAQVHWSGSDVRLQVLTAGLRSFVVQRRVDDGAWQTIASNTLATRLAATVWMRHLNQFRIAAIDRRSNQGAWVTMTWDLR